MKKILLLLVVALSVSCCAIVIDEETHFVEEKFMLIDKSEKEMVVDGDTENIRTWKIQRISSIADSLEIGEMSNYEDGCGCGILTDDLWNSREVGDTLYFEYIRKDRFHKVVNLAVTYSGDYVTVEVPLSISPEEVKATTAISMNKMEVERAILAKERELMALEREIDNLKESIDDN